MSEPKVLIIVEGKSLEPTLFRILFRKFNIKNRIYKVETNIYALFKKMEQYEFDADIKKVLLEMHPEHRSLLSHNFAYTYLIFDCDAHHSEYKDKRSITKIVEDNFKRLKRMIKYFNNETDPTVGKMYINYPMMESFRYCDDYFDESYKDCFVDINNFKCFKSDASKKKLANKRLNKTYKKEYISLMLLNVLKMHYVVAQRWSKPSYQEYLNLSSGKRVFNAQDSLRKRDNKIAVLNMSLLLIIDYLGDFNGFYTKHLKNYCPVKHWTNNK